MAHPRSATLRAATAIAATLFVLAAPGTLPAQETRPGAAAPGAAAAPPDAAQVERKLQSVRTLVESSSAARQIEASGNPQAAAQRVQARQFVRLAEEAHAAQDERSAAALLDSATRQMVDGARLAAGEQSRGGNLEREVGARIAATEALLAAQKRIAAEKPSAGAADASRQIEALLVQARAFQADRRPAEAQPVAQQAYLLAKASVGSMRGGDTLVRTLHFATKAEEYHYEVDRYETHRMLLDLLAKRQASDDVMGRAAVAKAAQLRRDADASAARGDHAAAVAQLEDATRELVRAIRAAGIFIPG